MWGLAPGQNSKRITLHARCIVSTRGLRRAYLLFYHQNPDRHHGISYNRTGPFTFHSVRDQACYNPCMLQTTKAFAQARTMHCKSTWSCACSNAGPPVGSRLGPCPLFYGCAANRCVSLPAHCATRTRTCTCITSPAHHQTCSASHRCIASLPHSGTRTVSYTHLTLPTILLV